MNNQLHIVPHTANDTWIVKVAGRISGKVFMTKKEAGRYAVRRANKDGLIRVVHGINGRFVSKKSY